MIVSYLAAAGLIYVGGRLGRAVLKRELASPPPREDLVPVDETPAQTTDEDGGRKVDEGLDDTRAIDTMLVASAAGTGLAVAGIVVNPVLSLAALPLVVGPIVPLGQYAIGDYREKGRIGFSGLAVLTSTVVLLSGKLMVLGIGNLAFFGGKRLQLMTRAKAQDTLIDAMGQWVETVRVVRDGVELEVMLDEVEAGDLLVVTPGKPIPADGEVIEGILAIDQRQFTGESRLTERMPGDPVLAGSMLVGGRGVIRAVSAGSETVAARLQQLINQTESYEQTFTLRSHEMVDRTFLPTVALGALGLAAFGPLGAIRAMWSNSFDVIWLSSPAAMLSLLSAASTGGIFVKDGRSLDQLETIDTIVFDKTGTLTLDSFLVGGIHPAGDLSVHRILAVAAAAELGHEHPIARAVLDTARAEGIDPASLNVTAPEFEAGLGLRVEVDGQKVLLGSQRLMGHEGIAMPDAAAELTVTAGNRGHTVIHLACDERYAGAIELVPEVRPEAREVIAKLKARGLDLMILTGDDEEPTRRLAGTLGIDTWFSRTMPEDKDARIEALVAEGRKVCFIGDGVNDALAMRRAHVSISMTGASTVAIDSAQIILRDGSLQRLDAVFEMGQRHSRAQNNLVIAGAGATTLAATGAFFAGLPLIGVVAISSIGMATGLAVAINENRWRPDIIDVDAIDDSDAVDEADASDEADATASAL